MDNPYGVMILISLVTLLAAAALGAWGAYRHELMLKRRAHVVLNVALMLFSIGAINVGAALLCLAGYALLYALVLFWAWYFERTLPKEQMRWLNWGVHLLHWALTALLLGISWPSVAMVWMMIYFHIG